MGGLGAPELLIIAIVLLVLFGARRLPDSARSLGRSLRIFKAETKGLRDDDTVIAPTGLAAGEPTPQAPGTPGTTPVTPPVPPSEQQRPTQQ